MLYQVSQYSMGWFKPNYCREETQVDIVKLTDDIKLPPVFLSPTSHHSSGLLLSIPLLHYYYSHESWQSISSPLLSSQLSFTSQSFQSMHSIVYSTNTKNTKFPWSPVYSMKSFMSAWPEALGDYWVLWELRSQNWSLPTFVATSDQYCWIFPQLVISLYTVFHFNISDNWLYKFTTDNIAILLFR